jgi:hypothetical protein
VVHDLDGDGHLDRIVPHQRGARTVVWWGPLSAAGWFSARTDLQTGRACGPAAVGDLDGDGHLDLVHPMCENGGMAVQPMRGRQALGPPQQFEQGTEPRGSAITDWDHDGRADLALWLMSGQVVVRPSTAAGFAPPVAVGATAGPVSPAPGGRLVVYADGAAQLIGSDQQRRALPTPPFRKVVRVAPGPAGAVILVGEGPLGPAAAQVRVDGGEACRLPPPLGSASTFADVNADGLLDEVSVVTCGYCTSSYRVGLGG